MVDLISDYALQIFTMADFVVIYSVISLLGIVANAINIFVFVKMGWDDTINISLFGLSVSDICLLTFNLLMSICYYPNVEAADVAFSVSDVRIQLLGWPYFCFKRIGNWIIAFITCERCLCIVLPLRICDIITPRRAVIVIVIIFLCMGATVSPAYVSASFYFRLNTETNKTKLVLVYNDNRVYMENILTAISFTLTTATFMWVITCSIILVIRLKRSTTWRTAVTGSSQSAVVSKRDRKVIKMVTMLLVIFMAVFLPDSGLLFAQTIEPELSFVGSYRNSLLLLLGVTETLLAINASVNILVYLTMSSKYRDIFLLYVCKRR